MISFTAEELREKADDFHRDAFEERMNEVYSHLDQRATDGDYEITYYDPDLFFLEKAGLELEENGFMVKVKTDSSDRCYIRINYTDEGIWEDEDLPC